jgi:hypothetical protein
MKIQALGKQGSDGALAGSPGPINVIERLLTWFDREDEV